MKEDPYVISIDPGVEFGVCVWLKSEFLAELPPQRWFVYRTSSRKHPTWKQQLEVNTQSFVKDLLSSGNTVLDVYCEYPRFFESPVGTVSARRGDLGKLYTAVGYLHGCLSHLIRGTFCYVPVTLWKGQLPKSVVESRLRNRWGDWMNQSNISSHAIDALGIGAWVMEHDTRNMLCGLTDGS